MDEGTIDNYLNIVIAGLVRKFIRVSKREETLQLATEGHVIHSEISFLQRKPSEVILQALEPTTVVSMSYESMMRALEKFPKGERLGRMILSRMYVKKMKE
ncbi:MAG: cyclic nucleotide-binding domain-containing protein [Chitinophagaceae bacterium]|nr:cyclic nucleotide-binding domain-containing protein [Chitinophagaceae bacterium]